MERPTCETCIYWEKMGVLDRSDCGVDILILGECHIRSVDGGEFTERFDDDWCGEHPDFEAYIGSLEPSKPIGYFMCACGENVDLPAQICPKCDREITYSYYPYWTKPTEKK